MAPRLWSMRRFWTGLALLLPSVFLNQIAALLGLIWGMTGAALAAVIGAGLLFTSRPARRLWERAASGPRRRAVMFVLSIGIFFGLLAAALAWFFIYTAGLERSAKEAAPAASQPSTHAQLAIPTLLELFKTDFPNLLKSGRERTLGTPNGAKLAILEQLYSDFLARSKFVGFYIPRSEHTKSVCLFLAENALLPMDLAKSVSTGGMVGERTESAALVFTQRVYVYHESPMTIEERGDLTKTFKARGLDVTFRGPDYVALKAIAAGAQREP